MNILLRDDGSPTVIDWTQLEISDSRFDLAWTLLLMSTQAKAEMRELILHEYEHQLGAKVKGIEYFDVFACVKRLGSIVVSLAYGPEKLGMRPEAANAMRQQKDALRGVYDLLKERTGIRVPEVEDFLV